MKFEDFYVSDGIGGTRLMNASERDDYYYKIIRAQREQDRVAAQRAPKEPNSLKEHADRYRAKLDEWGDASDETGKYLQRQIDYFDRAAGKHDDEKAIEEKQVGFKRSVQKAHKSVEENAHLYTREELELLNIRTYLKPDDQGVHEQFYFEALQEVEQAVNERLRTKQHGLHGQELKAGMEHANAEVELLKQEQRMKNG